MCTVLPTVIGTWCTTSIERYCMSRQANIRGTFGSLLGSVTQSAELITDSLSIAHGFVSRHKQAQEFLGNKNLEAQKAEGVLSAHMRLESVGKSYAALDPKAVELALKLIK